MRALIDDRGRLFGAVNLIDLIVVLALAGGAALVVIGFVTAGRPPSPEVLEIVPRELTAGPNLRVRVSGEWLRPSLKVYFARADRPDGLSLDSSQLQLEPDEFTFANAATGVFLVENQRVAEIRLPDLVPGTYTLALYDETEQVAVVPDALTIKAPPPPPAPEPTPEPPPPPSPPPPPPAARVPVLVQGAFVRLEPGSTGWFSRGAVLRPTDSSQRTPGGAPIVTIQSVGAPRPDVATVRFQNSSVLAPLEGLFRVPATLRVQCVYVNELCHISDARMEPGVKLSFFLEKRKVEFFIQYIRSELEVPREVRALVRFTARPETAPLIKVGDESDTSPLWESARIVEIKERREVQVQSSTALSELHQMGFSFPDKAVVIDAVVTIPAIAGEFGWLYRNEPVRVGASLNFETPGYLMRGWILGVTLPDVPKP